MTVTSAIASDTTNVATSDKATKGPMRLLRHQCGHTVDEEGLVEPGRGNGY